MAGSGPPPGPVAPGGRGRSPCGWVGPGSPSRRHSPPAPLPRKPPPEGRGILGCVRARKNPPQPETAREEACLDGRPCLWLEAGGRDAEREANWKPRGGTERKVPDRSGATVPAAPAHLPGRGDAAVVAVGGAVAPRVIPISRGRPILSIGLFGSLSACQKAPTAPGFEGIASEAFAFASWTGGVVRVNDRADDPGTPFYTRASPDPEVFSQLFTDGRTVAIPVYCDPACLPADFTLFRMCHLPWRPAPGPLAAGCSWEGTTSSRPVPALD
jgi:hypothetical protein